MWRFYFARANRQTLLMPVMPSCETSTGFLAVGVGPLILLLAELAGENLVRGLLYGSARLGDDLQHCLVGSPRNEMCTRMSTEFPLRGVRLLALVTDWVYPCGHCVACGCPAETTLARNDAVVVLPKRHGSALDADFVVLLGLRLVCHFTHLTW
jgi:hypothetical protein